MADLSIYLTWTGFVLAVAALAANVWLAIASGSRETAISGETGFGTFSVTTSSAGPSTGSQGLAGLLGGLAAAALGGAFAARWSAVGHAPFGNIYEFTTAFAFGLALANVIFAIATGQQRFSLVALPIVIGSLAVASLFPSEIVPLMPALQNGPLLALHVSVMMASYAVLTVAFCGAVVYLVQGADTDRRRLSWLPSREAAEELTHLTVIVGFPLLMLGIALGAYWANSAWGRYWGWDPKETSALVTLLALAAYFHARAGTGSVAGAPGIRRIVPEKIRRGRRPDPMWWLVVTWVLVMFTYFGVNLWISGLHSYAGV